MTFYLTQASFVIHTFCVQICSGATVLVAELIFLLSIIKSGAAAAVFHSQGS